MSSRKSVHQSLQPAEPRPASIGLQAVWPRGASWATSHGQALSLTVVTAICVAVVATTAGPRRDLDYWWHVLLGRALMEGDASSAQTWAVWPGDPTWRTAQPLAEVMLAVADQWWQSASPATVRAMTAAGAMAALAVSCRPWAAGGGLVTASRWWAFGCGSIAVLGFTQERPAQVGIMLMPLVGATIAWLTSATCVSRRRWLLVSGTTLAAGGIWSLSHQSWLLAWVVLVVAAALAPQAWSARIATLMVLAAVLAWGWVRLGPPWAAITTAGAAASLAEWQPTRFWAIPAAPASALVLAFAAVTAFALTTTPGNRWVPGDSSRYAALVVLGVAGAAAWRHVPVTVLAAGPILIAHAQAHALPASPSFAGATARQVYRAEGLAVASAIALSLALAVTSAHVWARLQPAPATAADEVAMIAARHTCNFSRAATIATHYNDSGPALAGARTAPCTHASRMQVVIDGRADRYGADALRRWQSVLRTEGSLWRRDWQMVDPDIALLPAGSRLRWELRRQGWHLAEIRSGYAVLYSPGSVV